MSDTLLQRLWHAATHNKRLKLASVLLALVSWFVVHSIISHERLVRDVSVSIRTDAGWAVLDASAPAVNVLFRGSQEDLRLLEQSPVRVEVDARKLAGGPHLVRLASEHVLAPGAARPIYMDPANLSFVLDQQGEKQVAVKADFYGVPSAECEAEGRCLPERVTLFGPRRRLAEIATVRTAPIDLEGRSRSFRKTHVALALSPDVWLANGVGSNITVEVAITERASTRTLQDVPVSVLWPRGTGGAVQLQPAQVHVTLRGRAEALAGLKREELRAWVDGEALTNRVETAVPVRVFAPAGLEIAAIEPALVQVRF